MHHRLPFSLQGLTRASDGFVGYAAATLSQSSRWKIDGPNLVRFRVSFREKLL